SIAGALMSAVGRQELAQGEWVFEWWSGFPVPTRALLIARVLETAVASPMLWFTVAPFHAVAFACAGFGWGSVVLGLLTALYVGVFAGGFRVLLETSLPRVLSARGVSRVQAVLSIVPYPFFIGAVGAASSHEWLETVLRFSHELPRWLLVNPFAPTALA